MTEDISWKMLDPTSVREIYVEDDYLIHVRRFGNPSGPRLILSHGNGLAIDLYYPFWSLLVDDFDLFVFDLRNHGWNSVGSRENHNIPSIIRDLEIILEQIDHQFEAKPKIGVFHSVSAFVALLYSSSSAALRSSTESPDFSAMMLFDPPVYKPGFDDAGFDNSVTKTAEMMRRRGNFFNNRNEFKELLQFSPNFQHFVPGAIDLMAKKTLRKSANGTHFKLRCPPEYEAQIIDYFRTYSMLVDFESLVCPTKVIGADPTLPYAYLPTLEFSHAHTVDYDFLPNATHFLQLEKPRQCAEEVKAFVNSLEIE